MNLTMAVRKWLAVFGLMAAFLFLLACGSETVREVPVEGEKEVTNEVPVEEAVEKEAQVLVTPTPPAATSVPAASPQIYQLGIFEDLTTTNYWSFLGADTTIWNAYVLSGDQPSLYGYSDQRFDWIPSLADGFPTPIIEETVGGNTFWTTEVDFKQGVRWSDGVEPGGDHQSYPTPPERNYRGVRRTDDPAQRGQCREGVQCVIPFPMLSCG